MNADLPRAAADPSTLSPAAQSVWAKSTREDGNWLPLWRHLADTAEVADWLWRAWLPRSVRQLIAKDLPDGDADGRLLLTWLGAAHDLGKVSPAFAVQSPDGTARMRDQGLVVDRLPHVKADRSDLRHELVSYRAFTAGLRERGWTPQGRNDPARCLALVVGSHHGRTPSSEQLTKQSPTHLIGQGSWTDVRSEYFAWSAALAGVESRLDEWQNVTITPQAQVLLTACVITADWIASDDERFDYGECIHDPDRAHQAMKALDLPAPWRAEAQTPAALFAARFGDSTGRQPRPVQVQAAELAEKVDEPGLLIIEAPMGEGKTEASLLAAEIFAARTGAGGLMDLLPTRATSSAMFTRVLAWLQAALPTKGVSTSVVLAHAKAGLDERYQGVLRRGRTRPGLTDTDEKTVLAVHQWFRGRKKALYSNFAVGTVDQLLFAGLKAKHLMLRHLAFANKVVVVDEVHSYDVYMSVYLERALEWLGAYRVPVILLSATLPGDRRAALVRAYESGRRCNPRAATRDDVPEFAELRGLIGYPVLTASTSGPPMVFPAEPSRPPAAVRLERFDEDEDGEDLARRLRAELADGGCAVVIRNSVRRVQHTAAALRQLLPEVDILITHARYVAAHRARKDDLLIEFFGPNGSADRTRPHVVVASQVVEQSLDVDFDLMITDAAPVDLLLQRIGRLHRHDRHRPARLAEPRCLVTGVEDWAAQPPQIDRGFRPVYSQWIQLRTLAALEPHFDGRPVTLPTDIPVLVEQVYGDRPLGPGSWAEALTAAKAKHDKSVADREAAAKAFLLGDPYVRDISGWLDGDAGEADEDAPRGRPQVRDSGLSLEVFVVRRTVSGALFTLSGIGKFSDHHLPTDRPPDYPLARAVASCALTLTSAVFGYDPRRLDQVIDALERNRVDAWQEQPLLEGELLLVSDDDGIAHILDDLTVQYGPDGLTRLDPLS